MDMTPQSLTISWLFSLSYMLFCIYRPRAARIFVGWFFIAMGLGINAVLVFAYPDAFSMIGQEPLVPFYKPIFKDLVPAAPAVWGSLIAVFETTMGLLILCKGQATRLGLIGATIFNLCIIPLNWVTVSNICLIIGHVHMVRTQTFDLSFTEMLRRKAA